MDASRETGIFVETIVIMKHGIALCICLIASFVTAQLPEGYSVTRPLGEMTVVVEKGGKYGIADRFDSTLIYVTARYDEIGSPGVNHPFWARIRVGTKYGFIDPEGWEVVKPQYDEIGDFNELHPTQALVRKGKKVGLLDGQEGHLALDIKYDEIRKEGELLPRRMLIRKGDLYGLYVPEEFWVSQPPKYNSLEPVKNGENTTLITRVGKRYGILFWSGEYEIKPVYDSVVWNAEKKLFECRKKDQTDRFDFNGETVSEDW
jgi:hypothetical protein